jgi:hypothetical protein
MEWYSPFGAAEGTRRRQPVRPAMSGQAGWLRWRVAQSGLRVAQQEASEGLLMVQLWWPPVAGILKGLPRRVGEPQGAQGPEGSPVLSVELTE